MDQQQQAQGRQTHQEWTKDVRDHVCSLLGEAQVLGAKTEIHIREFPQDDLAAFPGDDIPQASRARHDGAVKKWSPVENVDLFFYLRD